MSTALGHLPPNNGPQPRFPDDVDLRTVLRQGDQMTKPIIYSSDSWSIAGCPDVGNRSRTLNFAPLPAAARPVIKDLILLETTPALAIRLHPDNPAAQRWARRKPRTWGTAVSRLNNAKAILPTIAHLGLLTAERDDWTHIATELISDRRVTIATRAAPIGAQRGTDAARVLQFAHEAAVALGDPAPFGTRPFDGHELNTLFHHDVPKLGEQRNANEPVGDVFALIGAAYHFVDIAADDIINRVAWWSRHADQTHHEKALIADVRPALQQWRDLNLPMPGRAVGGRYGPAVEVVMALHGMLDVGVAKTYAEHVPALAPAHEIADPHDVLNGTDRPAWLPADNHLLPTRLISDDGLWWWCNQLVHALYFVLAGVTALRGLGIDAIPADPLFDGDNGRLRLQGRRVKHQDIVDPPVIDWPATNITIRIVRLAQRLLVAHGRESMPHDRIADHPILFSVNLLAQYGTNSRATGPRLLEPVGAKRAASPRKLGRALERLAAAGTGPSIDGLEWVSHQTLNQTSLSAIAYRSNGDLAAHAFRRWSNTHVGLGYYGNVPKVVTLADPDDLTEYMLSKGRGDLPQLVNDLVEAPERWSGGGVEMLATVIDQEPAMAGPVSVRTLARMFRKGALSTVAMGPFNACAKPGGKCGNFERAMFHLCVVDCSHRLDDLGLRARLELQRRRTAAVLGDVSLPVAKLDDHGDQFADVRQMKDDELIDAMTSMWPDHFREMFRADLQPTNTEDLL